MERQKLGHFLETQIAFFNTLGGLSLFDVHTKQISQLVDNSSFVSFLIVFCLQVQETNQLFSKRYTIFYLMFQRALNTTIYSLSQNLSHLLLRYDELRNTARYSLISLTNG